MLNQIRIIGGQWRGRKISFPDNTSLRPTPDRVKETLFNWLSPYIVNAICLDLFAGSGALSFEALSRGAAKVIAFEQDRNAFISIQDNAKKLDISSENLEVMHKSSMHWLNTMDNTIQTNQSFDIIFADPPYDENLLLQCFDLIETNKLLQPNGLIYFESNKPFEAFSNGILNKSFQILKEKQAGNVFYGCIHIVENKDLPSSTQSS